MCLTGTFYLPAGLVLWVGLESVGKEIDSMCPTSHLTCLPGGGHPVVSTGIMV